MKDKILIMLATGKTGYAATVEPSAIKVRTL